MTKVASITDKDGARAVVHRKWAFGGIRWQMDGIFGIWGFADLAGVASESLSEWRERGGYERLRGRETFVKLHWFGALAEIGGISVV